MSLLVLTSAVHSPGTTTTAVGLALTWPKPVLLVDADRVPSQSVLAGLLQGHDPGSRGLWGVLAAHRERRPLGAAIEQGCLALPTSDGVGRSFLPGFSHPGMVDLFASAWPDFVSALASWETDVIVDAGAIGTNGLPPALTHEADAVMVASRTSLVDLAGLRLYLPLLTELVPTERLSMVLVGAGRPYSASEISATLGQRIEASLPWNPAASAVWSHGEVAGRAFAGSPYVRAVRGCADGLAERFDRSRARIGAPR
ncbi:MAG: hypothetical protein WCF12_09295 [Propionicimonas sp.]